MVNWTNMENQMKPHPRNGLKSILTSGWNGFRVWNHWPFSTFLLGSFLIDFFYSQQKTPLSAKGEPSVPVTPTSDPVPGAPVTPKEAEDGKKVECTCENLFAIKTLLSVRNDMKSKEVCPICFEKVSLRTCILWGTNFLWVGSRFIYFTLFIVS